MLTYLHVRDFALIKELEIEFNKGLSVLTGETGAGKSIIIGSMNAISGQKLDKNIIRRGAEYALIEMIFELDQQRLFILEEKYGIVLNEEPTIVVSRKYNQSGRSIYRINNETVTSTVMAEVFELAIDIHSQHEHQSLLKQAHHIHLVDQYLGAEILELKTALQEKVKTYRGYLKDINEQHLSDEFRSREIDFLKFEVQEIEEANLVVGEDYELQKTYKVMSNHKKICETLVLVEQLLRSNDEGNVDEYVGLINHHLGKIHHLDDGLNALFTEAAQIESMLVDFGRNVERNLNTLMADEIDLDSITDRIHVINTLKQKFGDTIEEIFDALEDKKDRLDKLIHFDERITQIREEVKNLEKDILGLCERLSNQRRIAGEEIARKIEDVLSDLNFNNNKVQVAIETLDQFGSNGYDQVTFLISTNKNEPLQPLNAIASGGELSRVMLAIKSVFAELDQLDTMVFDEIDSGISGRTAQMVAEKMSMLSQSRQIICITHLPQIAAMADHHFVILKDDREERVVTTIEKLGGEEVYQEIARLIGGATITTTTLMTAQEMKEQGNAFKKP